MAAPLPLTTLPIVWCLEAQGFSHAQVFSLAMRKIEPQVTKVYHVLLKHVYFFHATCRPELLILAPDMSNSIESGIDIDFFGGIDIGIDIDFPEIRKLALTLTSIF